jgi:hypothetical protein
LDESADLGDDVAMNPGQQRERRGGACLLLLATIAAAACSSGNGGGSTGGTSGQGGASGAGGAAGNGGAAGSRDPYCPNGPPMQTLQATGFDAWNGAKVFACLMPVQSEAPMCVSTTVANGSFSASVSVCTGVFWSVQIGNGATITTCGGQVSLSTDGGEEVLALTPDHCTCNASKGSSDAGGTGPGHRCNGPPGDAAAEAGDGAAAD